MLKAAVFLLLPSLTTLAWSKPDCSSIASNSPPAYMEATRRVESLPEFKRWAASHSFPVAFGAPVDKQVLLRGTCYWSVSVYADRPERFEAWNFFLVPRRGGQLLVADADGEYVSLNTWRKAR
ncbi:hypothetical protein HNP55_004659 [Paucibacter oligotrophus]|uniref:Uncharacterized protein n=1 Tax=Roseateles oligotrophus TaxID=1769250 RepID=A0A840LGB9_9BURK|nr:hypothetical protein [Roseateles oligotrophus]MBB4846105.1 hypothetical protein [Roseateles oligotrophus]